ncbi:MAG TPA: antibiotic biosynthesis monooxygenase [Candidatus Acidoferrales bacterium]|nr:antibiotic biosynthesis monooxygenase [Candidatus Acidoferrales bacterium]
MVLARISKFHFKEGKREDGFSELDLMLNERTREAKGFRGFISFLSLENTNVALIVTLWEDEESLTASEKAVFADAVEKVLPFLKEKPELEHYRVFSTEMYTRRTL